MAQSNSDSRGHGLWIWGWFSVSVICLPFANGAGSFPLAAWLAPVGLVALGRYGQRQWRWLILFAVLLAAWCFQFHGMVPLPLPGFMAVAAAYTALQVVPLAIDAAAYRYLPARAGVLIYPAAVAAIEFGNAGLSPYGSWGSMAYSQFGNLPMLQIVSITGLYGLSFLICALASVTNAVQAGGTAWRSILVGYSVVVLAVAGWGAWRLQVHSHTNKTVQITGIAQDSLAVMSDRSINDALWGGRVLSGVDRARAHAMTAAVDDGLITRTLAAARAGSNIVLWSEAAGQVLHEDEPAFLAKLGDLARDQHIYIAAAYLRYDARPVRPLQNKVVLVAPNGGELGEFLKARPVPGVEANFLQTRTQGAPVYATSFGRLATYICFDMDFPQLVREASVYEADTILVPASDWREIDPWHARMAAFRAIETGATVVRSTAKGRSLAADPLGRIVGETDYYSAPDAPLSVDIVGTRIATLYGQVGDLFAWLTVVVVTISSGAAVWMQRLHLTDRHKSRPRHRPSW
jgi:apolipoprotein N-acyltransferase